LVAAVDTHLEGLIAIVALLRQTLNQLWRSPVFISIILFVLAFIPRLLNLDQFLTADEFLWVDRSRNFLAGMVSSDYQCLTDVTGWEIAQGLACTLRTGHPGVTTMWTGSLGLWLAWLAGGRGVSLYEYLLNISTNPLDLTLIAPSRIGTVLITSMWVVAVYWLVRRLLGGKIALLSALLLALNPFYLGLSRVIHHDALSTTFMTLSALTALIFWAQSASLRWLVASGILAGLGFLSKSPALFLMPFVAIVGVWFTGIEVRHQPSFWRSFVVILFGRTLLYGLLWFGVAVLTFIAFWPAMWVVPLETLEMVFFVGSKYATGGHAKGNFFAGEISQDPGFLFYPVTWLFRITPLVIVGVLLAVAGWVTWLITGRSRSPVQSNDKLSQEITTFFRLLPLFLVFVVGYYLLMSIGEKKQGRYFLPAYPWLDIIAAGGLVTLVYALTWRIKADSRLKIAGVGVGLVAGLLLLVNGFLVASHYPYYFTYYNPLLGGPKSAEKMITIGWGEGIDLAAEYLNHQVNPNQTRVASWYESTFAPYYYGPAISYSKEKGKALAGDYVIFYINQLQRQFPDEAFFDYFTRRFLPDRVIALHGINYVWIYPSLGIDHYVDDQVYTGIAALLAWQWETGEATVFAPGEQLPFELFWEYLGKDPTEPFYVRLVDAQRRVWAEGLSSLSATANPPVDSWREGEILVETGTLSLPLAIPPGEYRLEIGIYTEAPAVATGELPFVLKPEEARIVVQSATEKVPVLQEEFEILDQPLGEGLTLLGATLPVRPIPTEGTVPVDLYWRIEQPLRADADMHVGLLDQTGEARQAWFNLTLAETFHPTLTIWQPGDLIHTRWSLELLPQAEAGVYRLQVVLPNNPDEVLDLGEITIGPEQP
jgi:4-amino-4-deoxy-L-arabinose transferase-like glycosyltransferase